MSSPRSEAARRHETTEGASWQGDNLSDILGHVGPFHWTMIFYSTFAMMISGLHTLLYIIIRPDHVDHWCRLSEAPTNMSFEQWKAINIPRQEDGSLSQCLVYVDDGNETQETRPCRHRSFNTSSGRVTIIQEWDMTCDREWLYTAVENAFVLGSFFGLAVSGLSADRVGRKPVVCFCAVVLEVAGFSMFSVENVALFVAFRFAVAASAVALAYTNYVMMVEMTSLPRRTLYGTLTLYGFVGGTLVATIIVVLEQDWRTSQLLAMLPTTLLLSGFWLLPESPRWLINTLRVREAVHAVALILRRNRAPPKVIARISRCIRERPLQMLQRQEEPRVADMICSPRRKAQVEGLENPDKDVWDLLVIFITQYQLSTLSLCLSWFACSITYYRLVIDIGGISLGSTWATYAVASASPLAAYWLIVRHGRRAVLAVTLAATGACCLLAAFFHPGSAAHLQALFGAWFFINVAYSVLFIYATEIYPTTIRALGFNLGAAFGRIGTIMAPLLYGSLGRHVSERRLLSYVLLFVTCGTSGFLVTKLPETKETHLPDKIKPEQNIFDFSPMRSSGSRRARKPEHESTIAESGQTAALRLVQSIFSRATGPAERHSSVQPASSGKPTRGRRSDSTADASSLLQPGIAAEEHRPAEADVAGQPVPIANDKAVPLTGCAGIQHPAAMSDNTASAVFQQDHREPQFAHGAEELHSPPSASDAPTAQGLPTLPENRVAEACNTPNYTAGSPAGAASPTLASTEPVSETTSPRRTWHGASGVHLGGSPTTSGVTTPATLRSTSPPERPHRPSAGTHADPSTSEGVSLARHPSHARDTSSRRRRKKRIRPKF